MTHKTHQTAVVLTPPRDRWDPIQEIRERHDAHMYRWMPHITLLYPFVKRPLFDEAEEKIRRTLQRIEPFEVTLARFGHFHHVGEYYTLWLEPEPKWQNLEFEESAETINIDQDFYVAYVQFTKIIKEL